MKNIIKTSIIVIVGLLATGQVAFASSAVLSALPLSSSIIVGTPFNISVQIDPANNKVCVVKGTINFDNLSCQNITLASDLVASGRLYTITTPTCANPSFTLGITNCITTSQNLFSVSVKGTQVAQANAFFTGVKVIGGVGGGTDVAFGSQSGNYNIVAAVQKIIPVVIPEVTTPTENTGTTEVIPEATSSAGLEIPSGVGELNPLIDNGENVSTTSSSSVATTTMEKNNGLVATALNGSINISNKLILALILIAVAVMAGLIFYRRKDENVSNIPKPPQN